MEFSNFIVRFWGARGSFPVPGPHTVQYGGNTTCVELEIGGYPLIIDAGTGIINLGHELIRRSKEQGAPVTATILFTHIHHDHTQGFPFFAPAYIGTSTLHLLGPRTFEQGLEDALQHVVISPNFAVSLREMPSLKMLHNLEDSQTLLIDYERGHLRILHALHDHIEQTPDTIRVHIHRSYAHPRHGVYCYRVEWRGKSVVFASDTEGYVGTDRRLAHFARQTNLLIHDAQYSYEDYVTMRQGWGHSTPQMACDVAKMCNAQQLVLFHHDPMYDDEKVAALEREGQQLFANTLAAYEGLEIVL
ncbi:MAG: MBL fold metallo-hydrolase [Chloroflexaceae bacterium]|nr:MBL fold metallo-hydrolase [Chloroflexaceae bacterium]